VRPPDVSWGDLCDERRVLRRPSGRDQILLPHRSRNPCSHLTCEEAPRQAASGRDMGGPDPIGRTEPSGLVVGHFTDPEGNLIGVAGLA